MLFTHHFLPRVFLCLVASGLNAFAPVFAATPGEQDLIRDRQDRLLQEQQRRLVELIAVSLGPVGQFRLLKVSYGTASTRAQI